MTIRPEERRQREDSQIEVVKDESSSDGTLFVRG